MPEAYEQHKILGGSGAEMTLVLSLNLGVYYHSMHVMAALGIHIDDYL